MQNTVVTLDARKITDEDSFHRVFAELLGFPGFYGENMNAWIDCMTCIDEPTAEMTKIHTLPGHVLVLQIEHVKDFAIRCPKLYADLIECSAFVNWRRIERGHEPVLALSFYA